MVGACVSVCMTGLQCTCRVRRVPVEERILRLTSGPLFPDPGSGGGGCFSGPVLLAWEHSVGAWGPWSAINVSYCFQIAVEMTTVQVQHSAYICKTSSCPPAWLCSLAAACPLCVPPTR